ncbi:unnamed protein product [Thlaspi arvense]|uniref:CBS domain-containing protein n=1 Tax=Thlaspi arvense TaxID=13288 RepID=A0AAU9SC25_THLAR|nr:unnamed protein product [Thlaspi arvense]
MASVPEIKIMRSESLGHRSDVSSPEAKLGMRVEDLWDEQKPQLSPKEKLNACFESIPVSAFPLSSDSQGIKIVSEFDDLDGQMLIDLWKLEPPSPRSPAVAGSNGFSHDFNSDVLDNGDSAVTSGNFFEVLTSSELYKNTKVRDISGTFRWAPFLALQKENSFLTMLLLLSKYKMKSIPVVDLGEAKIENIITQSGVIHMLAECAGLHWFEDWGLKTLSEVGLPNMSKDHIIKIYEDEPVLQAFKLMRRKRIGGIPVVERKSEKPVGNISIRDVHFLLTAPEIYHDYRDIIARLVHEPSGYFGDFFDGVMPLPENYRV